MPFSSLSKYPTKNLAPNKCWGPTFITVRQSKFPLLKPPPHPQPTRKSGHGPSPGHPFAFVKSPPSKTAGCDWLVNLPAPQTYPLRK